MKEKLNKMIRSRKTLLVIGILLFICILISFSYAYFLITKEQENDSILMTDCFNISFTEGNAINLQSQYPTSDEEGMSLDSFEFTLTNTCGKFAKYQINLEVLNTSTLGSQYVKAVLNDNTPKILNTYSEVTPTIENADESYKLLEGFLEEEQSVTYNLRQWLDADAPSTTANKTFTSKIVVIATPEKVYPTLSSLIFKNNVVKSETPDFSKSVVTKEIYDQIPEEIYEGDPWGNDNGVYVTIGDFRFNGPRSQYVHNDGGFYRTLDNYGESFYFRGTHEVVNNNVVFAGFQWKIVRVNGDGSIRIIYNGTCPNNSCQINKISDEANLSTSGEWTKYQSPYASTSNAKYIVEEWYTMNILNAGFDEKISDTLFCSDNSESESANYYSGYYRMANHQPSLVCPQLSDSFTVSDIVNGNGALDVKVGHITADELTFAGSTSGEIYYSSSSFLNAGTEYWTMTLSDKSGRDLNVFKMFQRSLEYYVYSEIAISPYDLNSGIRPVINLKSDVKVIKGNGSASTPYVVE